MLQRLIKSPALRYGFVISISLIGYFILLSYYGLHTSPAFSIFNSVIIGFGIYKAISTFKLNQGEKYKYSKGFNVGIFTGFLATIIHASFFTIYITKINLEFPSDLLVHSNNTTLINSNSAMFQSEFFSMLISFIDFEMPVVISFLMCLLIIILGFLTSIILTYIIMNLMGQKTDNRSSSIIY